MNYLADLGNIFDRENGDGGTHGSLPVNMQWKAGLFSSQVICSSDRVPDWRGRAADAIRSAVVRLLVATREE